MVKTGTLHSIIWSGYCLNTDILCLHTLAACMCIHIHACTCMCVHMHVCMCICVCILEMETFDPSSSSRVMLCLLHIVMHITHGQTRAQCPFSPEIYPACLISSLQYIPFYFTVSRAVVWVFWLLIMHVDNTFQRTFSCYWRTFFSPRSDHWNGLSFFVESKLYHHDLHELGWKHLFFQLSESLGGSSIKGGRERIRPEIQIAEPLDWLEHKLNAIKNSIFNLQKVSRRL